MCDSLSEGRRRKKRKRMREGAKSILHRRTSLLAYKRRPVGIISNQRNREGRERLAEGKTTHPWGWDVSGEEHDGIRQGPD
jgi:hypothetical protein